MAISRLTALESLPAMFLFCSDGGTRMGSVQYHVVVAFGVAINGVLTPVLEVAAANPQDAIDRARSLGKAYAGAIAFSRTMDLGRSHYGTAKIHAVEGHVPKSPSRKG